MAAYNIHSHLMLQHTNKKMEILGIQDELSNRGNAPQDAKHAEQKSNATMDPKLGWLPWRTKSGGVEDKGQNKV